MYRTNTCGELRLKDVGKKVTLAGWVQRIRTMGGALHFIDLRDRYGITQLSAGDTSPKEVIDTISSLGREYVIQVVGEVVERESKNAKIPTGEIEIKIEKLTVLNASTTPPFTIEDQTDGGEDLRAKYRYLDLRRTPLKSAIELRHKMAIETRNFLDNNGFLEIETPFLIKSTPEGARDFVVPSRMNPGEFYALPQSPQTFKQLLMVAGFDRYFQIVRCFRDEDLRADRQPEFTQIDCEMSFVEREDILQMFEGLTKHLFKSVLGLEITEDFPRIAYKDAMETYGSDKPDIRFDMKINNLTSALKGDGFKVFDDAEYIGGIVCDGCGEYSRKQLDEITNWVKRPQVGASGLVYIKIGEEIKSSVDKFYSPEKLLDVANKIGAKKGDLILILCGDKKKTLNSLGTLRLEMGERLGLRDKKVYKPLWVCDFPLLEWDDETQRFYAMHHPFTSPKPEDIDLFFSESRQSLEQVKANAYDIVLNGNEIGGGSIRIFDRKVQQRMFEILGFTPEQAEYRFGFLMNAFKFGAPPHGGIAFGFDRLCALFGGEETIRDFIAFPKNNMGRDVMADAPSVIDDAQMDELFIKSFAPKKD